MRSNQYIIQIITIIGWFVCYSIQGWAVTSSEGGSSLTNTAAVKRAKVFAEKLSLPQRYHRPIDLNALIRHYRYRFPISTPIIHQHVHNVFIFVSFSMPKQSLRLWVQQAKAAGATLVLRGLVNNSFRQTAAAVQTLMTDQRGGLTIDPNVFRRFHIQQVPAVVVANGAASRCLDPATCSLTAPPYDVVYGDVSLTAALNEIVKKGHVSQAIAKQILKHIRTHA